MFAIDLTVRLLDFKWGAIATYTSQNISYIETLILPSGRKTDVRTWSSVKNSRKEKYDTLFCEISAATDSFPVLTE
jgi:hypothetical protein